jgi:hypothetical protein
MNRAINLERMDTRLSSVHQSLIRGPKNKEDKAKTHLEIFEEQEVDEQNVYRQRLSHE